MKRLMVVLLLAAVGCSSGDPAPTPTAEASACRYGDVPTVEIPQVEPPDELVTRDIEIGDGAEVANGWTLTVMYVGASWSNGEVFDESYTRCQPFPLVLGSGSVIDGWEQGLIGMHVGGQRRLEIPPELGYGPSGSGPIAPNETLVFLVELVDASEPV